MPKRMFSTKPKELQLINDYILEKGGSEPWRAAQTSLIELVIGYIDKPLDKITSSDILILRDRIKGIGKKPLNHKPNYQRRLTFAMRSFMLWYLNRRKQTVKIKKFIAIVEAIKLPVAQWKCKKDTEMLSGKDIEKAIKAASNDRDRLFLAMLWDSSGRPIELLNLTWEKLNRDEFGYWYSTNAKTGKDRRIRLTQISIAYIDRWRSVYPCSPEGKNPVFTTLRKIDGQYKKMNMDAVQEMFLRLRKKTELVNLKPGNIRPSKITADVASGFDLAFVQKKNWGHLRSKMIDKYTNLSDQYMDQTQLRAAGMLRTKVMKEAGTYNIEPPTCPTCQTINTLGSMFCSRCQHPLTSEARSQIETEKAGIRADGKQFVRADEVQEMIKAAVAAALSNK
jgi:integrase/recombinase XerD